MCISNLCKMLPLKESLQYLKGFPLAEYLLLENQNLDKKQIEKLGFPLWLKISSSGHKAKLGGVVKCSSFGELTQKINEFSKKFSFPLILQKEVKGTEIMLGVKQDTTFGKIIVFGLGGSNIEIFHDLSFLVLPVSKDEIGKSFQELKVYKILKEKNCKTKELFSLIEKLSNLNIKEADFNPIIVNEKEAKIIDARIEV